ncbi:MAG: bifunctional diguanylate cyclase/phosphodiesterase [Pseudomonadota bacterium]
MADDGLRADREDILARKIAELEYRVATDGLTGARSRDYFLEHFKEFSARSGTLFFMDLDNFKSVNDHYGHSAGDTLLQRIVAALNRAIGEEGFVARMGGDEFVILSPISHPGGVERLGNALVTACMEAEISMGELSIRRGASIGCVRLGPSMEVHGAIDLGDTAMRYAKTLGKNRVHHLNMDAPGEDTLAPSVDELRLGLERSEIGYFLQPIISCRSGEVAGFEALLRWERPNGQILAPAQFLDTMTEAYAAKARPPLAFAREATEWVTMDQRRFCSFNISMAFLERIAQGSDAWVEEIIGRSPRPQIVFEITEAAITTEVESVARTVHALRESGIRIALDDFGVGASNLERLQTMPVDFVKIDRRFVRGADTNQKGRDILAGAIDIAHSAGAAIVVEGIEEPAQYDLVRELGAELAQGFHLGKPEPYQRGLK